MNHIDRIEINRFTQRNKKSFFKQVVLKKMKTSGQHSEENVDKEEIRNDNFQNTTDPDFFIHEMPSTLQTKISLLTFLKVCD